MKQLTFAFYKPHLITPHYFPFYSKYLFENRIWWKIFSTEWTLRQLMIIILVEVTEYKPATTPQETFQGLLSICGGWGMRARLSLIPEQTISMVNQAKFCAVFHWFKNKGKHDFSFPSQYFYFCLAFSIFKLII